LQPETFARLRLFSRGAGLGVQSCGPTTSARPAAWLEIAPGQELHLVEVADFATSPFEAKFGRHSQIAARFDLRRTRYSTRRLRHRREAAPLRRSFPQPAATVFEVVTQGALSRHVGRTSPRMGRREVGDLDQMQFLPGRNLQPRRRTPMLLGRMMDASPTSPRKKASGLANVSGCKGQVCQRHVPREESYSTSGRFYPNRSRWPRLSPTAPRETGWPLSANHHRSFNDSTRGGLILLALPPAPPRRCGHSPHEWRLQKLLLAPLTATG